MLDTTDYTGEDLEALVVLVNYQDWIIDKFRPFLKGRIVEFGAGLGTFSRRLLPYSQQLELVESSPRLIPRLTEAFSGEPRVNIVARTMESHLAEAPRASCDAIVMVNVLEHIEDDLLALRGCKDMLRPGGALLIFVPALHHLYSEMDRLLGHYRRYERTELVQRVAEAGLAVHDARYFDMVGMVPWWLMFKLMRSKRFNTRMAKLYDRIGVPFTRTVERLVTPLLGKNIILVAFRTTD